MFDRFRTPINTPRPEGAGILVSQSFWETMKVEARIRGISISELIEEFGRSLINKRSLGAV
jgi:predicted DNA-binding ribbon-helix-helix protein